ncbi:CHC2 zinc finger domain-containing protein [Clostridium baratii]
MAKFYKGKTKEEKEKEVDKLLEKANKGIEKSFNTLDGLKELIEYMNKFYNYSMRNTFLIQEQFKGALAVGSYAFWKEKGYKINKGEKGIGILVPIQLSDYIKTENGKAIPIKKATKEQKELIERGEIEVFEGGLTYKKGYVFDIAQTNAKVEDLPKIFPNKWIEGEVENYDLMYRAMENIANKIGVKIVEPKNELGVVKGVSYPLTREIALNPRNTQLQNVKTLIHELTHAKLHTMETRDNYTKNEKEFQAEMAAYVVCSYFGMDTEEYSFEYINSWIKNAELKDKEKLVNEVRNVSKEYIEIMEETLINDKENSLSLEKEKENDIMKDDKKWAYRYLENKNLNSELVDELLNNNQFLELLDEKIYLDNKISDLKEDIKYYSNESKHNLLDELKEELKLNEELSSFISKEINLVVGSEIEEVKYKEKEYTIKSDIKLEDGSFVKKETSFFIEGFKDGNFKVHFENNSRKYYIDELDLEVFANPEKPINREYNKSNKKDLARSKTKNYDYKKVNYYDVNKLKELPIKEVCEQLGLAFEKASKDKLWTKIRNEKSSSCCINLDKNYWYDFGLGYGGDTIKLVQEVKGITPKEAIKELAEMFGIEGENVKNNFYLSKDNYKLIGIEPDRATLNLDINLEKQSIEEIKEIEKIYGRSMNELANYDKDKFLEIIKEKSIPILIGDKEKIEIVNDRINNLEDKSSKDGTIYYGMLVSLSEKLNTRIEIIEKIGLNKEMDNNNIYKIDEKEIEDFKMKSQELKVGEVKILKSENKIFRENEIMDFRNANEISNYEELRIRELKREYEKEDKYYPYEKVKGKVKISENETIVFRYDIGEGKLNNLADLLERELSNVNNQYTIKDFLIEQGVRENDKEEKGINFINDNFIYDKESELER